MNGFLALVHREYIEHKGAFLLAPMLLTALIFGAVVLGFTVGRVDLHMSGSMLRIAPALLYERGFLVLSFAWMLYLMGALFFYGAGSFSADRRSNAMLFWKSMPVNDLEMLGSKLVAGLTVLPASVFGFALLSGALMLGVMTVAMGVAGTEIVSLLPGLLSSFGQVAVAVALATAVGLLWYLPVLVLVGAMATVVGRWAVPVSVLVPLMAAILEWAAFGGLSPFHTRSWAYLSERLELIMPDTYLEEWFLTKGTGFSFSTFAEQLLARIDWLQMGLGWALAAILLYFASEYRRRFVLT